MNRSLRLLRPATLRPLQPAALTRQSFRAVNSPLAKPLPSALTPSLSQLGLRFYAGGKDSPPPSGSPKDQPRGEQQNETTGMVHEIKNLSRDLAGIISGGASESQQPAPADGLSPAQQGKQGAMGAMEVSSHSHGGSVRDDFVSVTTGMFQAVPKPALYFGLAGLLPYLGTSVGIVGLAREAHRASAGLSTISGADLGTLLDSLHTLEHIQITYGAIILSFLGAIHWGMEFSKLGGAQGYQRLAVGTIPVLFAWPTTFLSHGVALAVQWFGFTGMWFLDQRASSAGWTTSWYSTYRFYLSIVVGFSIIATFAGTGYYGAGAGANMDATHKHIQSETASTVKSLEKKIKEKRSQAGRITGHVGGDISLEDSGSGDAYMRFHNKTKDEEGEDEEEEQAKQEEKAKNEEFQDVRDEHQMDKAPGTMKNDAKDRTGKNANVPGGEREKSQGGEEGVAGKGKQGKREEGSSGSEKSAGNKSATTTGEIGGQQSEKAPSKQAEAKSEGDKGTPPPAKGGESLKENKDNSDQQGKQQQNKDDPTKGLKGADIKIMKDDGES